MGGSRTWRRVGAALLVLIPLLVLGAPNVALASHTVAISAGDDCRAGQRVVSGQARRPVKISVCSTLPNGQPFAGHQFFYNLNQQGGPQLQRQPIPPTDARGSTSFTVTPERAGFMVVQVCDEEGCYGRIEIEVSQGAVESPPPVRSPSPSPSPERPRTVERPRPKTVERPITTDHPVCWWCWGIKLLFVLTLVCVLIHHIIKQEWWSWWFLWFLLIFIWVPFFLAFLFFFAPPSAWWWWIPLLLWIPMIGLVAWRWGKRLVRWRLPIWVGALVWWAAIGAGLWFVGPRWWFLLPVFWVPWVLVYAFGRGFRLPWWRHWLWIPLAAYVFWVFAWFIWFGPLWGWVIPALVIPAFLAWIWFWWGKTNKDWWGPKICFTLPWAWFPWFAFMNLEWDPWWCWVVIGFIVSVLFCFLFHFVRKTNWWVWWGFWLIVILVWIPLFLGVLVFFDLWWWWIPLLAWFPAIGLAALFWGRKQPWWGWWSWGLLLLWWAVIGWGLWFWQPVCWFLLPVFWAPWVLIYLFGRAIRQPWWRWWLLIPIAAYLFWAFYWVCWLTPVWWWVFIVLPVGAMFFWFGFTKQTNWKVISEKFCFFLPWIYVPVLAFAFLIYCDQPQDRVAERITTREKPAARTTPKSSPATSPAPKTSPATSPAAKAFSIGQGAKPAEAVFDNRQGPPENCPPQFTDNSFTVETKDDQVIISQASTNEVVSGPIKPDGAFTITTETETYAGQIGTGPEPNTFLLTADYSQKARGCSYRARMLIRA